MYPALKESEAALAVESIPAFVERCDLFIVLAPDPWHWPPGRVCYADPITPELAAMLLSLQTHWTGKENLIKGMLSVVFFQRIRSS